jgi:hypothetical protein
MISYRNPKEGRDGHRPPNKKECGYNEPSTTVNH